MLNTADLAFQFIYFLLELDPAVTDVAKLAIQGLQPVSQLHHLTLQLTVLLPPSAMGNYNANNVSLCIQVYGHIKMLQILCKIFAEVASKARSSETYPSTISHDNDVFLCLYCLTLRGLHK